MFRKEIVLEISFFRIITYIIPNSVQFNEWFIPQEMIIFFSFLLSNELNI